MPGVAAHQGTVDAVLLSLEHSSGARVVRQPRRERVVRERPLEERHGLHRADALGQAAQRERHQPRAEAVPDEVHTHARRRLGELPDHPAETTLTDRPRAPFHGVVRRLPQQFVRPVPGVRESEPALCAGHFEARQRPRELLAGPRRGTGDQLRLALRYPLRHGVRREQRLRPGRHHLHQQPDQPPELLQLGLLRRLLLQQPRDLVDEDGPAREGLQQRVPRVLVEHGPPGCLGRHGPRQVRDRFVGEPHRGPQHSDVTDPGRRGESRDGCQEPVVEPVRARAVGVPAVREDDQIAHLPFGHPGEQAVALSARRVPVRVEGQLPVGSHTHRRIHHDRPPRPPGDAAIRAHRPANGGTWPYVTGVFGARGRSAQR